MKWQDIWTWRKFWLETKKNWTLNFFVWSSNFNQRRHNLKKKWYLPRQNLSGPQVKFQLATHINIINTNFEIYISIPNVLSWCVSFHTLNQRRHCQALAWEILWAEAQFCLYVHWTSSSLNHEHQRCMYYTPSQYGQVNKYHNLIVES